MKKAEFIKAKIVSVITIVLGIIITIIFWVSLTKSWQNYRMDAMTYSFLNPISGETVYHSGSDIGELSLFEFAFSDDMDSAIWIVSIAVFVLFVVIAVLVYAFYFNQELIVNESGIKGKATIGKEIDISIDRIASVKKSFLKGVIVITNGQEKIKFRLMKNHNEIIEAISKGINTKSMNALKRENSSESSADQLKKYKELLDDGIISQEEFDAKKKQLLGL